MKSFYKYAALSMAVGAVLTTVVWSQARPNGPSPSTPDGTVASRTRSCRFPALMSEGSKKVLMRTQPTEGPGAPVPVPGNIPDMAEMRRVYNENLKPIVDHMRSVFPSISKRPRSTGSRRPSSRPRVECRRRTRTACS